MNADKRRLQIDAVTGSVIGAAQIVSNTLGCGYLEKVYRNAMFVELKRLGRNAEQEQRIKIRYRNVIVGDYIADLIVENLVIVELKCVESFSNVHTAQCLNYLKATDLPVALLLNFQKTKVEIKRVVYKY